MKNILYTVIGIIALTAVIGIALWMSGFPPPKSGQSENEELLRTIMTFPLFWASLATILTVPIIFFKSERLQKANGKAKTLPRVAMIMPAITMLLAQIIVPLDIYDIISEKSGDIAFFGFIAFFFLIVGNYVATIPFESPLGFRSKATVSSPAVWTKVHRFVGRNIVIMTLLVIPLAFIINVETAQWLLIGLVVCTKAIAWIYARQLAGRIILRKP